MPIAGGKALEQLKKPLRVKGDRGAAAGHVFLWHVVQAGVELPVPPGGHELPAVDAIVFWGRFISCELGELKDLCGGGERCAQAVGVL
jgi:hypothetical protein